MRRVFVNLVGVALAALVDLTGVPMLHDAPTAMAADLGAAVAPARAPAPAEACSGNAGCGVATLLWWQAAIQQQDDGGTQPPHGNGVMTGNNVQIPITSVAPIQLCNNNVAAGVIAVPLGAASNTACQQEVGGLPEDDD